MNVEDIKSYQTEECMHIDSYCTYIFHLAYATTMGWLLGGRNNIKSFGTRYTIVPTDGKNLWTPHCFIKADGTVSIILSDYTTGDKCRAVVMDGEEVCIHVVYQFTNQITQEAEIRDICEELYDLILALSYHDKIKELKDMQEESGIYMLTEQDLKDIIPGDESAEVIELR